MVKLTNNGFESNYDIDQMLYNDAIWLSKQIKEDKDKFIKVARQLDLGQKEWDIFWKRVRAVRSIIEKQERDIEVVLNGKETRMTKDEFEFAEFYLGEAEEVSNCCGEPVIQGGICSDCKEHCGVVYILES